MLRFFLKKFFLFLVSLFIVISLTFFIMKMIPGDPFTQEQQVPKEILESLQKHYGLDQSLLIQYGKYLKGFLSGNFGPSFIYEGRFTSDIIKDAFPISLLLGLEAFFIALFFGIILGSISAIKHHHWPDRFAMILTILGISLPNFLLATLLQYIFSMKLSLLPVARWGSFWHTILPALSLSFMPMAFIARLIRSNLLDILDQNYIKLAKIKGLSKVKILYKHALLNASIPVISYLGSIAAHIFTGSFIIEKIFGIPGLGGWMINSIYNRDYTVIMGLTVFYSILLMSAVLIADILYGIIDPRMNLISKKQAYVQ